jgi:preprotein translocase subunit YajC
MSSFALFFAQVTNAVSDAAAANPVDAAATQPRPIWTYFIMYGLLLAMVYFAFFRPQIEAKKKQEETIKSARTGDKVVTSSGIHGVITNVKESTVIVRVADNVKLEIEKTHIDKITRPDSDSEKVVTAKVS